MAGEQMVNTPSPADEFSFGLWTVGWQARDPFGDATRPPLDPVRAVHRLAELGAWGITFHDDDVVPFGSRRARPRAASCGFAAALDETGLVRADGHHQPVLPPGLQGGRVHRQRPRRAPLRAAQGDAQPRPRRRARRPDLRVLGRPRGRRGRRRQGRPRPRSTATARRSTSCAATCVDRGYDIRFALEPKPNEPRGDIFLPTVGHALAFINTLEHADMVGLNPEVGHEQMSNLNMVARHRPGAVARQAVPHRPQRPARPEVRPGPGVRPRRPAERVRPRRSAGVRADGRRLRRPAALRLQAAAHRGRRRGVGLGRGEHAHLPVAEGARRGVPRRPRGAGGAGGGRRRRLRVPTLAEGESLADLLADRSAFEELRRRRRGRRSHGASASTSWRSSTCSAPADRPWRSSPGSTRRRSRARSSSATPTPAPSSPGPAPHPDGTEVDPDAWWAALEQAVADGRRAGRCRRGLRRRPAARHGAASTRPARWCARRCCGTTPARPARPTSSSPSSGRRGVGRRDRLGAGRLVHDHQAALAGRPRARRRRAHGARVPAARLAHLAAARRARLDAQSPIAATPPAPATGRRSTGAYRADLLRAGARPDAAVPRVLGPGRGGRPATTAPGRPRARARATTWPPRSGSAAEPGDASSPSARPASPRRLRGASARPLRHRRRVRRRHRPLPAPGRDVQRRPDPRRPPGCSASTMTGCATSRSRRPPGAEG